LIKKSNFISGILAILIGLIFGLPHILIPVLQDKDISYTPLVSGLQYNVCGVTHDESLFYGAQLKEIFDGRSFFSDVDLYEYRDVPNPFSTFPYFLLGNFAKIFGSVERLFIVADFIFPPLIFFFSYLLILSFTEETMVAIFGSIFLIFGLDFFRTTIAIIKIYLGYHYAFWNFPLNNPHPFSRFISPEFNLPFFFLALFFLHRGIKRISLFYSICSGILLGILFHSYLYFWTFYVSGCSILLLTYLLKKDFLRFRLILLVLLIGVLISIPYFLKQFEFSKFPNHDDILSRFGLIKGRFVEWYYSLECLAAIFLLLFFSKERRENFFFLLSFMIAGLMCLNLQVLTGSTIQNHHWLFLAVQPWFVFILSFLITPLAKKVNPQPPFVIASDQRERNNLKNPPIPPLSKGGKGGIALSLSTFTPRNDSYWRAFEGWRKLSATKIDSSLILKILIIFLLFFGLTKQTIYALRTYKTYTLLAEEKVLFTWLKGNSKRDDVILTLNKRINDLIPVYTENRIFLPNGILTFASDEEIIQRLIIAFKLYGVDEDFLKENLPRDEWGFHLFHLKYAQAFYGKRENFPKELLSDILRKYRALFSNSLIEYVKKYRLDYIYVGSFENKIIGKDFGDNLSLKEVFNKNGNRLYEVVVK